MYKIYVLNVEIYVKYKYIYIYVLYKYHHHYQIAFYSSLSLFSKFFIVGSIVVDRSNFIVGEVKMMTTIQQLKE